MIGSKTPRTLELTPGFDPGSRHLLIRRVALRSFLARCLVLCALFGNGANAATVYFSEDFEQGDARAWTFGSRSDEHAISGKHSLRSHPKIHRLTVARGEGFFHAAGDLGKSRITFAVYSRSSQQWKLEFFNHSLRTAMEASGSLEPGKWNPVSLTLADLSSSRGPVQPGHILSNFSLVAADSIWLDDLRMETEVSPAQQQAQRPRMIRNKVDPAQATAKFNLKVVDKSTGEPTAARVVISGNPIKHPNGALTFEIRGVPAFFHTSGVSKLALEPGTVRITATKGMRYRYATQSIALEAGTNPDVIVELEEWVDLDGLGFHGGDSHIHPNYRWPVYVIGPDDLMLMARAEDLQLINANVANAGPSTIYDLPNFSGHAHEASDAEHILYYNEEYRSSAYGHLCLWKLTDLIFPVHNGFGPPSSVSHYDYPPNKTILEQVRSQKGIAAYPHPYTRMPTMKRTVESDLTTRELPVDAALIGVDAMDIMTRSYNPDIIRYWWRLLNTHLKIPGSAGTDAMLSGGKQMMGQTRVYVKSGSPLDYDGWIEAYSRGRSFVTTGPYVWMTVNREEPGSTIRSEPGSTVMLNVEVEAKAQFGLRKIQIVSMGRVIHEVEVGGAQSAATRHTFAVDANSWVTAHAIGEMPRRSEYAFQGAAQFATTSPVYVDLETPNPASRADGQYFVDWIAYFQQYLDERDRYGSAANKAEVTALLAAASRYYEAVAAGKLGSAALPD